MSSLIQNKVYINKEQHRYFDYAGNEFTSVSKILSMVKEPFDEKRLSAMTAKKLGVTQADVLADWKKKRDDAAGHGTRIHDAIEEYKNFFTIKPSNMDLEPMLKSIAQEHSGYARCYSEALLYSPSFEKLGIRAAGTTDQILKVSTRSRYVDIEDYKTNLRNGIEFHSKYNKYLLGPVSHMQECNYNTYSLQLSIYALMYEELTGDLIRSLYIRFIPPNNPLGHYRIPVPYMKLEAWAVLNYFGEKTKADKETSIFDEITFD